MQKYKIIKRTTIAFLMIIIIQISIALVTNTAFFNVSNAGTYGNFEYIINSETDTVTITKYLGNEEEVTIPNMIEGKSVTCIGERAFANCRSLTNIIIPEGVKSIGDSAFYCCEELNSITIPEGVTRIGDSAFYCCKRLYSITIPEGVTRIGDSTFYCCKRLYSITIPEGVESIGKRAFEGCDFLDSITIPKSVMSIGDFAFYECEFLTNINVDAENQYYKCKDGLLLNKDGTKLIYFLRDLYDEVNYTIPSGVISIENGAFACCSLENVIIPEGVTNIGNSAFNFCTELTSIVIPNSVKSIGKSAFSECYKLTSITIPEGVTCIDDYTFWDCDSLTNITFPKSLTSIGVEAFVVCKSLTNIIIPDGVTSIGDSAFEQCEKITSLTIPNSVTNIGRCAFWNCKGLKNIKVSNSVTLIEYGTFQGCSSLDSIIIPKCVTSIEECAFKGCKSLTNITIHDGLKNIGNSAFGGCENLTNVKIPEGLTSIGMYAFSDCISLANITIPNSVTNIEYKAFYNIKGPVYYFDDNVAVNNYINAENYNIFVKICLSKIEIETEPKNKNYVAGQNFDKTGMVVKAKYNDGSEKEVTNYTVTDGNNLTAGKTSVTISYTENNVTKTTTQAITVVSKALTEIKITTEPKNKNYVAGQNFDKTGMIVKAKYNDGSEKEATNYTVIDGNNLTAGKTSVTISYTENNVTKTTSQAITVEERLEVIMDTIKEKQKDGIKYIENINPSTTIEYLLEKIETNGTVEIYKGTQKGEDENVKLATGMKLKIYTNKESIEYTIVVTGDLNGDGKMGDVDVLKLARYKAGLDTNIKGAYLQAADINRNNTCADDIDLLKMVRILVGYDRM